LLESVLNFTNEPLECFQGQTEFLRYKLGAESAPHKALKQECGVLIGLLTQVVVTGYNYTFRQQLFNT
jgi:hypothetical protein